MMHQAVMCHVQRQAQERASFLTNKFTFTFDSSLISDPFFKKMTIGARQK